MQQVSVHMTFLFKVFLTKLLLLVSKRMLARKGREESSSVQRILKRYVETRNRRV